MIGHQRFAMFSRGDRLIRNRTITDIFTEIQIAVEGLYLHGTGGSTKGVSLTCLYIFFKLSAWLCGSLVLVEEQAGGYNRDFYRLDQ